MYDGPVIDAHTHPLLYPEGQVGEPSLLAGGPFTDQFIWVLRKFGIDRVIYGSDYPIGDPVADLEAARSLGFDDTEQAAVLHDNAAALLGR